MSLFAVEIYFTLRRKYFTIIPRARMGSESTAREGEGDSETMRARGKIVLAKSN